MIDFSDMSEDELRKIQQQATKALLLKEASRKEQRQANIQVANARLAEIKLQLDALFGEVGKICGEFEYGDDIDFYYSTPNDLSIQYIAGDGWYSSY